MKNPSLGGANAAGTTIINQVFRMCKKSGLGGHFSYPGPTIFSHNPFLIYITIFQKIRFRVMIILWPRAINIGPYFKVKPRHGGKFSRHGGKFGWFGVRLLSGRIKGEPWWLGVYLFSIKFECWVGVLDLWLKAQANSKGSKTMLRRNFHHASFGAHISGPWPYDHRIIPTKEFPRILDLPCCLL